MLCGLHLYTLHYYESDTESMQIERMYVLVALMQNQYWTSAKWNNVEVVSIDLTLGRYGDNITKSYFALILNQC